jgi:hypothetical protein
VRKARGKIPALRCLGKVRAFEETGALGSEKGTHRPPDVARRAQVAQPGGPAALDKEGGTVVRPQRNQRYLTTKPLNNSFEILASRGRR